MTYLTILFVMCADVHGDASKCKSALRRCMMGNTAITRPSGQSLDQCVEDVFKVMFDKHRNQCR